MTFRQGKVRAASAAGAILLGLSVCSTVLCTASNVAAQTDIARMSGAGQDIRTIVIAHGIYQFMTTRAAT